MKRIMLALLLAAALTAAGAALASNRNSTAGAIILKAGQAVSFGGLTCTAYAGTTATNANIVCVRDNLRGFGVVVSQDKVVIAKKTGDKLKVVFKAANK